MSTTKLLPKKSEINKIISTSTSFCDNFSIKWKIYVTAIKVNIFISKETVDKEIFYMLIELYEKCNGFNTIGNNNI